MSVNGEDFLEDEDEAIVIRKLDDGAFRAKIPGDWTLMEIVFAHRLLQAEVDHRFARAQEPRVKPVHIVK